MDKDIFKLIMKQKNKLLFDREQKNKGTKRRQEPGGWVTKPHKKTVQQVYTCACACRSKFLILEQKVPFRWCRRKPGIHKDNHPTRIRDTLHIHIYFLWRQVTSKSRQLFELVYAGASSLAIQIQQVIYQESNCCHCIIWASSEMTASW